MSANKSKNINYWSEAFNLGINLGDFENVPLNKIFLGLMAIVAVVNLSPALGCITMGLEFSYLFVMVNSKRFHEYIKGKALLEEKQAKLERLNGIASTLKMIHSVRLGKLNNNITEINRLMNWNVEDRRGSYGSGFLVTSRQESLNQIAILFLKLLRTKQVIEDSLGKSNATQIRDQIAKFENQLFDASPAIEKSIKANIDIYQKRLENFDVIRKNSDLVELELQRIENQVSLFRESLALDSSPESLSANIDIVNSNLTETQNWINKNGEFLRKLNAPVFSDDTDY